MNNIEILEDYLKFIKQFNNNSTIIPALENLIQENKELKISNEMKQLLENNMLGYIRGYEDGRNGSTGLAYQVGKQFADYTLTLKLNKYKEDYLKARKLLDESIPKSKVKEKIEYYHHKDFIKVQVCYQHDNEARIKEEALKELLEEGE